MIKDVMKVASLIRINFPRAKLNESLANKTTFGVGGKTLAYLHVRTPEELWGAVSLARKRKIPYQIIAGGSNVVFADETYRGLVIVFRNPKKLHHTCQCQDLTLTCEASLPLAELIKCAIKNNLAGLESLSGIPGTVGGAIVGNAGAWGKQIGDVLTSADLISPAGRKKTAQSADLHFTYRDSILKKTGDMVASAKLSLHKGDARALLEEREKILAERRSKHPDLRCEPCAGSFFRNVEPTSKAGKRQAAGWFLEEAGGKKLKVGGAVIFPMHANIIIKSNGCRSQDVHDLSLQMARIVKEKFDLDLVREVRFVGKFRGMPANVREIIW